MNTVTVTVTDGHYPAFRELAGLAFKVSVVMSATDLSFDQGLLREQQLQRLALAWNSHNALVSIVERYARECGECGGRGDFPSHREDPGGHSVLECWECADIRAVLAKVQGGVS